MFGAGFSFNWCWSLLGDGPTRENKTNKHQSISNSELSAVLRYDIVKRRFEKLGYEVSGSLCNAADFGVPQQRRRAWVLGILKSELKTCGPRLVEDMQSFQISSTPSLRTIIDEKISSNAMTDSKKTVREKELSGKWVKGFEEMCKKFGKATLLIIWYFKSRSCIMFP